MRGGSSSRPVIGVVFEQRPGAVERFGDDDAHEAVRQRQARQRPALVGARDALGAQAVGTADEQSRRARRAASSLRASPRAPSSTTACRSRAARRRARRAARARACARLRRGSRVPTGVDAVRRASGNGFDLERAAAAQPLRVFVGAVVDPLGLAVAGRDQRQPQHRTRRARSALGVFGARRHVPELLEVIELAHARQHHVHDEIARDRRAPIRPSARLRRRSAGSPPSCTCSTTAPAIARTCRSERPLATIIVSVTVVRWRTSSTCTLSAFRSSSARATTSPRLFGPFFGLLRFAAGARFFFAGVCFGGPSACVFDESASS